MSVHFACGQAPEVAESDKLYVFVIQTISRSISFANNENAMVVTHGGQPKHKLLGEELIASKLQYSNTRLPALLTCVSYVPVLPIL